MPGSIRHYEASSSLASNMVNERAFVSLLTFLPSITFPFFCTNLWQQQQLLRPSLLRPEELSMESGIDRGQDYYSQDYYNYDQGYGSRRRLIPPMYDEYGEVIMEDEGYYYPEGRRRGRGGMRGRGRRKRVEFREDEIEQVEPAEAEPSKAAKKLKSVMKLSKLLAASKAGQKPSDAGPSGPSPWKKAKMFKMFGVGKKDKDYAKLMSARRIDSQDSLTDGPALTGPIDSKSDTRSRLGKVLRKINISNKLQQRRLSEGSVSRGSAAGSGRDEEASQVASEDEKKSKVSISVTESEPEASGSGGSKEKGSDEEASEKSSVDKDYLKVDLDRDDANESTVDSEEEPEEEPGDSDEERSEKEDEEEEAGEEGEEEEEEAGEEGEEEEEEEEEEKESATEKESGSEKESESEKSSGTEKESGTEKGSESGTGTEKESTEKGSGTERGSDEESEEEEEEASDGTRESGSSARSSMRSSATEASKESGASGVKGLGQSQVAQRIKGLPPPVRSQIQLPRAASRVPRFHGPPVAARSPQRPTSLKMQSKRRAKKRNQMRKCLRLMLRAKIQPVSSAMTHRLGRLPPTQVPRIIQTSEAPLKRRTEDCPLSLKWMKMPSPLQPADQRPQAGRKKRIKLVVDRENETSSTGEESTTETQRNRIPNVNSHSNINGNVYFAQNGTIVRTRRPPHPNNLKVGSPCRLGKHFKKLDKLGVTHEEPPPINSNGGTGNETENGTGTCVSSNVDVNLNTRPICGTLGSTFTSLKTFGSKTNIAKVINRNSSGPCVSEEQETSVDNHRESRETLESHSDHTLSEEEELWMGPWNNLHIPMTKL
ncbi:hypothetical protein LDENG_00175900 [Lucifuga dentata]|nr:hypothetical protein LDENG_00175900 [Lucifuga dentata]